MTPVGAAQEHSSRVLSCEEVLKIGRQDAEIAYRDLSDELANGTDNADDVRKGTPAAFPEVAAAIRAQFGDDVKSIQDLFDEEGGPEWWQTNGVELYHAVFDLTTGSRSLEAFNDYSLDPKRGGVSLCLKNPI